MARRKPRRGRTSVEGRPGPDRSLAELFWCIRAAQRGWSIEETANKLPEVSGKVQERVRPDDEGYALITAQNGAAAARRGTQDEGNSPQKLNDRFFV